MSLTTTIESMHLRTLAVVSALLSGLVAASSVLAAPEESGLPLPRFVSLRAEEANMRTGPGEQYPIRWTYRRSGLPLEVVREYHHWRRVRDWQGSEGWMHSSMLSGKRSVMVVGEVRTLRDEPDAGSAAVARVEGPVVGRLLTCTRIDDWCRIEIEGVRGWLRRAEMWGVYAKEKID